MVQWTRQTDDNCLILLSDTRRVPFDWLILTHRQRALLRGVTMSTHTESCVTCNFN